MSTENKADTSGLAFPGFRFNLSEDGTEQVDSNTWRCPGMTLRQYAAIHLSVPDSGLPWLDEMIRKHLKQKFAMASIEGMLSQLSCTECRRAVVEVSKSRNQNETVTLATMAKEQAIDLLSELEKK